MVTESQTKRQHMEVINLFGGPGTGKSTTAALVFAQMKQLGLKAELVTEYAKDKVWEKSFGVLSNQLYVFGKQHHRLWRLQEEVDYAICDSPLAISLYYGKACGETFLNLVMEEHYRFPTLNILLERVKPYMQYGRYQDEEGAKKVDVEIKEILDKYLISYENVVGDDAAASIIVGKALGFPT